MDQNAQILAQLASTPGLQQHLQQMFANSAGMAVINRDNRAQPQFSMGANTPELAALSYQHEMMQPNPNGWASREQGYQFQPVDPALLQHMQKLYGQTPNGQMLQAQQLMSQMNPRPSQQLQ